MLLASLPALLGKDVRVIAAPCIGRCEQAPAVAVGPAAGAAMPASRRCGPGRRRGDDAPRPTGFIDRAAYEAQGGYRCCKHCIAGERDVESVITDDGRFGPARPRRRRLPGRAQVAHRAQRSRAAADGGEHRRRRTRHLQGPRLPRARPAPLSRRHADRRLGGRHRAASTSTCATSTTAAARCSKPSWPSCARSRPIPACPRSILRRGAGAYICGEESAMIESIEGKRGMPRLRPPYVAQVGLFGRPTLEHNFETLYWVRELLEKGGDWFASHGRHGRKGLRSFSVSGRVKQPGREAGAGRHHDPRADRRTLRRHAGRPRASTPTCRAARRAASCRRRWATSRSTSTPCSPTAASSARPR